MTFDHGHSREEIRRRLSRGPRTSYLRDWIFGGIDGAVTTFAVVAAGIGGGLSSRAIIILGVANLLADGFSMAASNYSGTTAEVEGRERLRAMERDHVRRNPDGERDEVREIYRGKGFTGEDLERVVAVITADDERWVETMLAEEHGQPSVIRSPTKAGASTFSAFVLCGTIPLLPFLLALAPAFPLAIALTGVVFFSIGAAKSHWSLQSWWRSGAGTFAIGMTAALIAYAAGAALGALV